MRQFYGRLGRGRRNNDGTVFEILAAVGHQTLALFNVTNGSRPWANCSWMLQVTSSARLRSGGPPATTHCFELAHGSGPVITLSSCNQATFRPVAGSSWILPAIFFGVGVGPLVSNGASSRLPVAAYRDTWRLQQQNGYEPLAICAGFSGSVFGTTYQGGAYNEARIRSSPTQRPSQPWIPSRPQRPCVRWIHSSGSVRGDRAGVATTKHSL